MNSIIGILCESADGMEYIELHCRSNFSFLQGASHADELVERAAELGYGGIAITDCNTLAGVVRAYTAGRDAGFRTIVGCEVHPIDGPPLLLWPQDREGYGQLCRLLSVGRLRASKGECAIRWQDIADHLSRCLAGLLLQMPKEDWLGKAIQTHRMSERFLEDLESTDHLESDRLESDGSKTFQERMDGPIDAEHGPTPSTSAESKNFEMGWTDRNRRSFPEIDFEPSDDQAWQRWLNLFREIFGDRGYLPVALHRGIDDRAKLVRYQRLSQRSGVPLLATGDVQYHIAERMVLHDCLAAIAIGGTIEDIRSQRPANSQRSLLALAELRQRFREHPEAMARTVEVAARCEFQLDQLRYEYPTELAPDGQKPIDYLKRLTWNGAKSRYPRGVPEKVIEMLRHEVGLIEELRYEAYFLTVWDLVRFARSKNILCQGRGSAANSIVCYCLGITSVDPNQMDLLFERFISRERNEAPDIDVDFEHQRREEVLQYIYEKYGRHRAGMTATVITYRIRSAVRDVGKSLGISLDRIDALSKIVDGRSSDEGLIDRCRQVGIEPESEIGKRFLYLVETLIGFPRHLSQHVGGMVMTQGALCELCPIENASMEGRTVIQWDKDDLDELGILKVDCLSLGMLSAIHRCFDMIQKHYRRALTLADVPQEDASVYEMICQADTVGVFQIESRAQMSMLPRLKPKNYYDLVIEVAIVRPGPIQGQMVHPYLKARQTGEQPSYPNDAIRQVLAKTMGVPIFQEQAMKLAVVAAGFTPGEADQLRRAMAAWRRPGVIDRFRLKLIEGMRANGLDEEFAERVFTQIRGFGEYGFPESHAASFALLVYVSAWIKHHYPAVFCASILNSLPMGFYGPSQLIQDAQRHGVLVRPVDVNNSDWDCKLEPLSDVSIRKPGGRLPKPELVLRMGLRMIRGLPVAVADKILESRASGGPFREISEFVRRTKLGQAAISGLAEAGALSTISGNRRAALWQSLAQEKSPVSMPLLEAYGADIDEPVPSHLTAMSRVEEVYADYETTGVSLRGHPISFCRRQLERLRVVPAADLPQVRHGRFVRVAGIVVLRQRPGTAKGITFVTLEDETGSINLVIRQETWKQNYMVCKRSNAWLVHGILETRDNVTHVIVGRVEDLSEQVSGLDVRSRDFR